MGNHCSLMCWGPGLRILHAVFPPKRACGLCSGRAVWAFVNWIFGKGVGREGGGESGKKGGEGRVLAGLHLLDAPGSEASGRRLEFKAPGAEGGLWDGHSWRFWSICGLWEKKKKVKDLMIWISSSFSQKHK